MLKVTMRSRSYRRFGRVLIYLVAGAALSSACGDSDDGDESPGPSPTTGNIGPSGGVVTSTSGAEIRVPAGAVDEPVTLSIAVATDAPGLPSSIETLGDVYALTPHGQQFLQPVTIRIPFEGGNNPELYTAPDGGRWSRVTDATEGSGVMVAEVEHFSFFVVIEAAPVGGGGSDNGGGGSPAAGGSPSSSDGGSPSMGGSGTEGGSPATGGSSTDGGAPATGGSSAEGGSPAGGGAGGAGGGNACEGPCGGNQQPCCPDGDSVSLPDCGVGNGTCSGYSCGTLGFCEPFAG